MLTSPLSEFMPSRSKAMASLPSLRARLTSAVVRTSAYFFGWVCSQARKRARVLTVACQSTTS